MPNSNYVIGRSREYSCMKHLRKAGALEVSRSYASHGLFDVRAIFPDKVLLIQCKTNRISPEEKQRLADFAQKLITPAIQVQVWIMKKRRWHVYHFIENTFVGGPFVMIGPF